MEITDIIKTLITQILYEKFTKKFNSKKIISYILVTECLPAHLSVLFQSSQKLFNGNLETYIFYSFLSYYSMGSFIIINGDDIFICNSYNCSPMIL